MAMAMGGVTDMDDEAAGQLSSTDLHGGTSGRT